MIKILLVRPHIQGLGGVANYYRAVVPYLDDHEFKIFSFEIGSFKKRFFNMHPLIDQLRFCRALKVSPDIVHVNPSLGWKSFIRDGLFIWQAKRRGLKVLVFFRGWDDQFADLVGRNLRWFFRTTFAKADKFIVLASDFGRQLQKWGVKQPIQLGTTVVDDNLLKSFNCQNKLLRLQQNRRIKILYLARLERDKGVFEVIDAVKLLVAKGLDVSLAITGDGLLLPELCVYINSLNLPKNCITLLGYVVGEKKV
ncbi:MAG: glycosyltransferase, partial [Bacteroidales bacterium]|nr:glycosyltransferase [Bacteroidales bacterium]